MRSSFFGLNIALQGLYTSRSGLQVTGHNIANAKTEGYSRQQQVQRASNPLSTNIGNGMIGTGSEVKEIRRIRDKYLDTKYWFSNNKMGEFEVKTNKMKEIEAVFGELSDSGFNTVFNNVFDALQDLTKNSGDESYRTAFVERANSFAEYFNGVATKLSEYQRDINFEIERNVSQVNDIADQIQRLNKQIYTLEINGDHANDLRDNRTRLVDQLSKIINVEAKETKDQNGFDRFNVKINGQTLVSHFNVRHLKVVSRENLNNPEDVSDLNDVAWDNGHKINFSSPNVSGQLKAYFDIRDGNNKSNFKGIISNVDIANNALSIKNPLRNDLIEKGEIRINNRFYKYDGITYDDATDTYTLQNISPNDLSNIKVDDAVSSGSEYEFKGIPYYQQKINHFVRTFAEEFNKIHKKGKLDDGSTGHMFFDCGDGKVLDENKIRDYMNITAGNFSVCQDILDNVDNLAVKYDELSGESDNTLVKDLIKVKQEKNFDNSDPGNYMEMLLADVGVDTKKVKNFYSNEKNISSTISNQRISVSGVDMNEEGNNMIIYQQAYNLAAKMMSVMNETYDVVINRMGV